MTDSAKEKKVSKPSTPEFEPEKIPGYFYPRVPFYTQSEELLNQWAKAQTDIWKVWMKQFDIFKDISRAYSEFNPILFKYWQRISEEIQNYNPEKLAPGEDYMTKQRELFFKCASIYSEMTQEIMATPSFSTWVGKSLNQALDRKIQVDNTMEEVLKTFRIATRTDVDSINETLYNINKKVDEISDKLTEFLAAEKRKTR